MSVLTARRPTDAPPPPADPDPVDVRGFRRRACGAALIAAPLTLLLSEIFYRGTSDPQKLITDASHHSGLIAASNLLLLLSAALFVPAAVAVLHLARDRGRRLAAFAAVFAVLGSLGHAAYVGFSTVVLNTPKGDRAQMVDLITRVNHSPALAPVAICIFGFTLAAPLLALAAWRAGLVRVYAPVAMGLAFLLEIANVGSVAGGIAKETLALAALSRVGVRVLRMSNPAWSSAR